jgi:hypothetical protein
LGLILGINFGGFGVVIAWGITIAIGVVPIIFLFHLKNKISLIILLFKPDL